MQKPDRTTKSTEAHPSTVTSSVANAAWGILLEGNQAGNPHEEEQKISEIVCLDCFCHEGRCKGEIQVNSSLTECKQSVSKNAFCSLK